MGLDDMGSGPVDATVVRDPSQWCGKHAPAKPGLCPRHSIHFLELHEEEIQKTFGVEAIFYCPQFGCDEFSWDSGYRMTGVSIDPVGYFIKHHYLNSWLFRPVVEKLFENAARQRILFVQQQKLVERLEKAGVFEGGKKT